MSKDVVRQTEFGRDHGLIHEMVVTGRKAGAGSDFYATLAHDLGLFRKVVDLVCGTPAEIAFHDAVKKGVTRKGHYYRFFDPGISLVELQNVPAVREQNLIDTLSGTPFASADKGDRRYLMRFRGTRDVADLYAHEEWAHVTCAPQERFLRIPMRDSFGKTFHEQEEMLSRDEEIASARVVTLFLVINQLATGKVLLPNTCVRCKEPAKNDGHWKVGRTSACVSGGILIVSWDYQKDAPQQWIGAAAMKKL